MEQKQKLEIGERIKWLRDNSAETSRTIARYCDVSDEAVRNWIAGKGIKWENADKVAAMFKLDVDWVWRGEGEPPEGYPQEEKPPAPDLMTTLSADDSERLKKIEKDIAEILKRLPAEPAREREIREGDGGLDDAEREAEQTSQDDQQSAQDADRSANQDQARQRESGAG